MTTAAPIASRGTSAHLPAGLVVLHPARTASARTASARTAPARTAQGRSRVPVSSPSVRSSRAAHAPRPAQVAQPAHAPAVSTPAVSAQTSSAAQAPGAKSALLAKGGELLRAVPASIRRLGTVRGFLKGLPLLTLAALIVLGFLLTDCR